MDNITDILNERRELYARLIEQYRYPDYNGIIIPGLLNEKCKLKTDQNDEKAMAEYREWYVDIYGRYDLPSECILFKDDKFIMRETFFRTPLFITNINPEFLDSYLIVNTLLTHYMFGLEPFVFYKWLPEKFKNNGEIIHILIDKNPNIYFMLPEELQTDLCIQSWTIDSIFNKGFIDNYEDLLKVLPENIRQEKIDELSNKLYVLQSIKTIHK